MFADLHLHTLFSDGTFTPEKLIQEAKAAGLCAISVVDHDTVGGIERSIREGRREGIEVLAGIELTCQHNGAEVHILGYFIDYRNKELASRLDALKEFRIERIYKIIDKLKQADVRLDPQKVFQFASQGTVGRLHVARAMVAEKLADSIPDAFRRFIGDGCPAYVCGFRFSPPEAIRFIRDYGGIPVLAHPYCLNNDALVLEIIRAGIMGLEAYYSEHTPSMVNLYCGMAKKFNLLVTGGSDCHGEAKSEIKIGSVKIPYALVERLKEAKEKLPQ